MGSFGKKQFIGFTLRDVLKSVMRSCFILDVTHLFVQRVCAARFLPCLSGQKNQTVCRAQCYLRVYDILGLSELAPHGWAGWGRAAEKQEH